VVEVVERVRVADPVGVTVAGLKEQLAPVGSVDDTHDSLTAWDEPLVRVAVMVFVPELPCCTLMPPELDRE